MPIKNPKLRLAIQNCKFSGLEMDIITMYSSGDTYGHIASELMMNPLSVRRIYMNCIDRLRKEFFAIGD